MVWQPSMASQNSSADSQLVESFAFALIFRSGKK
jgi:hypothetical protein